MKNIFSKIARRKHKLSSTEGFTIVEMLTSVLVFSVTMIAVGGIFVQLLAFQKRGFAAQQVQENTAYVLESIAREIRVSTFQNQDSLGCNSTSLSIIHPVLGPITYTLAGTVVQKTTSAGTVNLNTSDVAFTRFNFCILGSSPVDNLQTRVTILTQSRSGSGNNEVVFDSQTTITLRDVLTEL